MEEVDTNFFKLFSQRHWRSLNQLDQYQGTFCREYVGRAVCDFILKEYFNFFHQSIDFIKNVQHQKNFLQI
jgi:hypothetical protein